MKLVIWGYSNILVLTVMKQLMIMKCGGNKMTFEGESRTDEQLIKDWVK